MFSFFPDQGLVEHVLVDISWIMVGNYVEKKVMLYEKTVKVAKGERKRKEKERKRKEKNRKTSVLLCS